MHTTSLNRHHRSAIRGSGIRGSILGTFLIAAVASAGCVTEAEPTDVAEAAGLERGLLSFENLRWVSALRDFRRGAEPNEIRQRLGLSKITWRETKLKLERLKERMKQAAETPNPTS